jgi:hypothetical protein
MDKRLEEHLNRMRALSAQVGQIHEQLAQNTQLMARDRESMGGTPLDGVRDFRSWRGRSHGTGPAPPADVACAADRTRARRRRRSS